MGQFDQAPFPMTHDDVENLIEAIQPTNVYVDLPVSIPTSGWSNSSPYVYTYTNSKITAECGIEVDFLANSENADVMYLEYEKVAGGVQFTAPKKPTVAIPVNIRVINADAEAFESISADMVSTNAVSGAVNAEQALSTLDSKITSKEWSPSEGDSLLTWLLANLPDRTKLPFSFMKKGMNAVSDSPFKASVEFSGIVDGHGDRLNVTMTAYNNSKKYYRAIWQNNWNGSWTEVFVKDKRSFTLADGESSVIACESDSGGLFMFKATAPNLEYIVVKGYAWINKYAKDVSSTNVYEFNYTNAANITFSAADNGIIVTNNSGKEVSCSVVFYPVLKS